MSQVQKAGLHTSVGPKGGGNNASHSTVIGATTQPKTKLMGTANTLTVVNFEGDGIWIGPGYHENDRNMSAWGSARLVGQTEDPDLEVHVQTITAELETKMGHSTRVSRPNG